MSDTTYHKYECSGYGHTTIIDKYYKTRRVFCGVCGEKSRMDYQNECQVQDQPKPGRYWFK